MTLGAIHYPHKYREELTLETDKPLEKSLTIVLASDLHVGYHNRRAELGRWVDLINAEKPDLVLIGGDIIDRSLRPVTEGRYEEEFRRIEAPVWTVLGNHETYAGLPQAEQFFQAAGIRVLKDSVAHFKGVDLIGRKDRSTPGRAALRDLADGLEGFTLVLDHQPSHLEEAEAAGVDFQFSGHTHRGQVWPVSWATDLMFEKSWGHYRKGNTRYYISKERMTKIPYTGTNQAEFKAILGDKVLDPYFCMGLTILSILTDDGFVNVQEGDIVVIDDDGSIRIE